MINGGLYIFQLDYRVVHSEYDDRYCEVEFSNEYGEKYALQAICVVDFVLFDE